MFVPITIEKFVESYTKNNSNEKPSIIRQALVEQLILKRMEQFVHAVHLFKL